MRKERIRIVLTASILVIVITTLIIAFLEKNISNLFIFFMKLILWDLIICSPLIIAIFISTRSLETKNKKKILWRLPLISFIIQLIIVIIIEIILLISTLYLNPVADSFLPIGWPITGIIVIFLVTIAGLIISIILYKTNRKK